MAIKAIFNGIRVSNTKTPLRRVCQHPGLVVSLGHKALKTPKWMWKFLKSMKLLNDRVKMFLLKELETT